MSKKKQSKKIFEDLNENFGYYYTWEKSLVKKKTKWQDLQLIQTKEFGKVLLLDGITQVGEKNEYLYHEPMVHPGLLLNPKPEKVLVIGGGDGGINREVLKHPEVKSLTHVDIDGEVIEFSQKHLPGISNGAFKDKRTNVIVGDGRQFVFDSKENYDAVIMDMTDPFGPSQMLYSREFFTAVKKTLKKKGGTFCMHAESPISRPRSFNSILNTLGKVFPHVTPVYIYIQMYSVLWCVAVCSTGKPLNSLTPAKADALLKKKRINNLKVINGETLKAMQAEYPYVSQIRKAKAKIITDKDPDFEDNIDRLS